MLFKAVDVMNEVSTDIDIRNEVCAVVDVMNVVCAVVSATPLMYYYS
jgi:hypothetical protein